VAVQGVRALTGGWQHHQALALLATWFLVQETRLLRRTLGCHNYERTRRNMTGRLQRNDQASRFYDYYWETRKRIAPQRLIQLE
jgi:hypothetical protein